MTIFARLTYLILGLIFSLNFTANGQEQYLQPEDTLSFKVFKTQNLNITIHDVLKTNHLFKSVNNFTEKTHPDDVYWIRLNLEQEQGILKNDSVWILKLNAFDFGELYYKNNNTITKKFIGLYDDNSASEKIKAHKYYSETPIKTSELINKHFIYLKVKRVRFLEHPSKWKFSYLKNPIKDLYTWSDFKSLTPYYIFIGISSIMGVFMLVFFAYFKRPEFLFYSLYVFFLLLYLSKEELLLFDSFLSNNTLLSSWFLEDTGIFIGISYMLFTIYYLDLKRDYNFAYQVFKISLIFHVLMLLVDFIFYFSNFYIGHIYILKIYPIIDSIAASLTIGYILFNLKNHISTLYIIGSTIFIIGVGYHFYLNNELDPLRYNKLVLAISTAIEIMIFAFALTYKVHLEHIDRLNFQQEAFTNKTKALRAQINPHFIFNSLSSIQSFITSNNKVSALKYLSKFSRLTRNILESSIETNVVLDDEIKMLKDYLELESLRFDDAFTHQISIDKNLNSDSVEVPFMILQPFVENAIIHGLLPKKVGFKKLTINLKKENDFVICEVDDNGVGRKVASQKENIHKEVKKSRGLEVTKQRLETLSDNDNSIKIIDKTDGSGAALGTKVIVRIPL